MYQIVNTYPVNSSSYADETDVELERTCGEQDTAHARTLACKRTRAPEAARGNGRALTSKMAAHLR